MNHDAKKSIRHFMKTLSACIALVAAVMFLGCKQNVGNESKTPAVQYKVTFEKTLGGNVTVIPALPESGMVNKNTELTFTATKLSGYKFVKWERDGADTGVMEPTYKLTVTQTVRIKAVFEVDGTPITKHTVTFSVDGGNGSLEAKVDGTKINSGDQVEQGKTVEFTAKPFSDYSVDTWSIDGSAFTEGSGAAGSQTAKVKITAGTTVKVKFKPTLTDQEKVEKAKDALQLSFQNGDTADSISANLPKLPMKGLHNTKISWKSSNEVIIEIKKENEWNCYGSITRPEENTQVILTATITRSAVSITKTFDVTVRGTNEDAVISAAEQAVRAIPSFVTKDTPIQLSPKETVSVSNGSSSSSVEVDIEWKAEPAGVISVSDGTVTPHETETQTVTLTATAKKGNAESSKTVTVTVYPKNNEPNLQAVVESIINGIPTEIDADIQLPQSPTGYQLTWSSSNDSILKIAGNSGHIETWDLVNRMVELTATLKKNTDSKTATKKITIKARKKFGDGNTGGSYEFDGNKLTLRNGDGKPAAVYRVSIDTVAKTITATLERIIADGSLVEPEAAQQDFLKEIEELFDRQISVLLLQQKPLVTLRDIRNALEGQFGLSPFNGTEEELKDFFEGWSREADFKMTYEEFLKKTKDEQSTVLKELLKWWQINFYYKIWGLDETVPLTEAEKKVKSSIRSYANDQLESAKKPHIYYYLIKKDSLYTNVQYSIGTSWFRQPGEYRVENPSSDIASIEISGAFKMVTIGINKPGSSYNREEFVARSYNGSTSFTAEARGEADKKITVTITGENKDAHTLSVQISGAISFTGDFTFSGRAIPSNWFQS
ncbi:immunoglobulin-like domain-containing protein [Treponema sp. OMZ 857]|uniref:immunoglobulin-like domain-containing protein n=1 Tax=Treponema sp. OMZ 857 TaxID=1643513 RepID=UPI0020A3C2BC|nr:immunoglobulin-like domain-containing protein [Treponema sp. OMZ 857]UTC43110.1 hypothetical protein E4N66_02745 [Treponema sp. OMZ 857]